MAQTLSAAGKRRHSPRFRIDLMPYLFILPAVIIYVIFNLGPVLASFFLSFFRWDLLSPTTEYIGFKHYDFILNDDKFWNALSHNFIFLILAVIIPVWMGLFLAVFIYEIRKGRVFFRAALFLPAIFSGVVIAYVLEVDLSSLRRCAEPDAGTNRSGRPSPNLGWAIPRSRSTRPLSPTLGPASVIRWLSFSPGLQDISTDIFDAARVDGANFRQKLVHLDHDSLASTTFSPLSSRLRIFHGNGRLRRHLHFDGRRTLLPVGRHRYLRLPDDRQF